MAYLAARCCCGASIEVRQITRIPEITQSWWKLHALCSNAWQREHGLDSRISFDDDTEEEQ